MRVGISCRGRKLDVRGQRGVAGDLLPNEVEAVHGGPDIGSRGGDRIGILGAVVVGGSSRHHAADIGLPFKDAQPPRALGEERVGRKRTRDAEKKKHRTEQDRASRKDTHLQEGSPYTTPWRDSTTTNSY